MAKTQTQQTKEVVIIARYTVKASGNVAYRVRNGGGKEYCITLSNGRASCTCDAYTKGHGKHQCYHVKHVLAEEAARQRKQQIEQELQRIDEETLAYIAAEEQRAAAAAANGRRRSEQAAIADIGARGNLSSNRGFSLLK